MGNRYTGATYPRGGPCVRVPVTPQQLDRLRAEAQAAALSVAEYVRHRLGLSPDVVSGGGKGQSHAPK